MVGWVTIPFFSFCFLKANVLCTCSSMYIYMYMHLILNLKTFLQIFSILADLRVHWPWRRRNDNSSVQILAFQSTQPSCLHISIPPFPDPRSSILTLGRVPVMNVLHNVMTMQSYLHETKPYLLCCRGVDPKQQVWIFFKYSTKILTPVLLMTFELPLPPYPVPPYSIPPYLHIPYLHNPYFHIPCFLQLLPPASSMEDSPSQARPGFDTTFAEEMNALNR